MIYRCRRKTDTILRDPSIHHASVSYRKWFVLLSGHVTSEAVRYTTPYTNVAIVMQLMDTFSRGHGGREDGSLTFGDASTTAGIPQVVGVS